ncbi:dihydrofolate reductase family protein [Kribbella qitaiheensis]|uniref:Dihydrofolate reductase family protein n=1 Tax=Kribbella qitaiheensis TaxID=1544730 RepID=A0A7G6X8L6_9ACTN|nr:dihydrofolate reductase family protein [Kribbella qitaiheensis]QNE22581.1 dihydrofolate reductase family protein [Kribbella qitaiheensis]
MRKIIYYVHQSLDGFIEGPNGEFDWPVLGPELSEYSMSLTERVDLFLYGRTVWEMMSSFWPTADTTGADEHEITFAPIWREMPKLVLSTTLQGADWNTEIIRDAEALREIKSRPGKDILLTGSATVAATLTELGLLEEYHVIVHPVLLGGGKPVYHPVKERLSLELAESRTFDNRTVLLRHDLVRS